MYRHQFRAIGEGGLHLYVMDHLRHPFHHVIPGEQGCALRHQLRHRFAIAGPFQNGGSEIGHGFWVVELETAIFAALGQQGRRQNQQLVLFLGRELYRAIARVSTQISAVGCTVIRQKGGELLGKILDFSDYRIAIAGGQLLIRLIDHQVENDGRVVAGFFELSRLNVNVTTARHIDQRGR